jgi:hypothetical protein
MRTPKTRVSKAVDEFFIEIYKISEPPADFKELVANAPLNSNGQKDINFDNYEIDEDKFTELVEKLKKKYKLTSKLEINSFNFNCYLGPSPRFKKKEI